MKSKRYLWMGWLFVIPFLHGCTTAVMLGVGAGAGLGTYSYIRGELKADYPFPYDRTWNAALTALERLEIEVNSRQRDSLGGKITGKKEDGKLVVIKIKDKSMGVTGVGVRVGVFGDQDASRKIQETIFNVLKS